MSVDLFDVWQDFADDAREHVLTRVDAECAVRCAKNLTESVGARLGTTMRVIITDPGDYTVFEWLHGHGVVFPTREQCAEASCA